MNIIKMGRGIGKSNLQFKLVVSHLIDNLGLSKSENARLRKSYIGCGG